MAIGSAVKTIATVASEPLTDDLCLSLNWHPKVSEHPSLYTIQGKLIKVSSDMYDAIYSNPICTDAVVSHIPSNKYITISFSGDEVSTRYVNVMITGVSGNENLSLNNSSDNRQQIYKEPVTREDISKASELVSLLDLEPIEDGYFHPAEQLIEDSLRVSNFNPSHWVYSAYIENLNTRPAAAAGILRCLGRMRRKLVGPWGLFIAVQGLSHYDIEVREAAVRALERWGGQDAFFALKDRVNTEPVHWLAAYIKQVIMDLVD